MIEKLKKRCSALRRTIDLLKQEIEDLREERKSLLKLVEKYERKWKKERELHAPVITTKGELIE